MTSRDRFGAELSSGNNASIDKLNEAAILSLSYRPNAVKILESLLDEEPGFVMARCLLSGLYLVSSDKSYQKPLSDHYKVLQGQVAQANDRERAHIQAISLWLEGGFYASSQAYADVISDHPRDLCALQIGHQIDFLTGQAASTRDRPSRVLDYWSEADSEYSYVLGMQAFGFEECGHFALAEDYARKCIELNPKDVWGVHALAHCFEMQGKVDEGIEFMTSHECDWASDENFMRIHNRWHLLLFYMEKGEFNRVLEVHDTYMAVSKSSELMDMHDSVALLWRLHLNGVDVGNRFETLADRYSDYIGQAYMSFTDMHAAMAFAGAGRHREGKHLIEVLEANKDGASTSSLMIRVAGLDIARGILAFGQENFKETHASLSKARYNSSVLGGSIAQRDVINVTLLEAAVRSGRIGTVKALIAERSAVKPQHGLTKLILERALNA